MDRLMLPPQVTGEAPPFAVQIAQAQQQAYQEALAQANLSQVQGLALKSQAEAARAHAQAQDAAARSLSTVADTVYAHRTTRCNGWRRRRLRRPSQRRQGRGELQANPRQ
jgi:hypothetical protein